MYINYVFFMKNIILFSFLILSIILSSCASIVSLSDNFLDTEYYSDSKRRENNTVKITSDVKNFQISYDYMNERQFKGIEKSQMHTSNGEINFYMPTLRWFYTKRLKVESPGFQPQYINIRRGVRSNILVKDIVLGIFSYGLSLVIDPLHRNFYKVSKKSRNIRVDFVPAQ